VVISCTSGGAASRLHLRRRRGGAEHLPLHLITYPLPSCLLADRRSRHPHRHLLVLAAREGHMGWGYDGPSRMSNSNSLTCAPPLASEWC